MNEPLRGTSYSAIQPAKASIVPCGVLARNHGEIRKTQNCAMEC